MVLDSTGFWNIAIAENVEAKVALKKPQFRSW